MYICAKGKWISSSIQTVKTKKWLDVRGKVSCILKMCYVCGNPREREDSKRCWLNTFIVFAVELITRCWPCRCRSHLKRTLSMPSPPWKPWPWSDRKSAEWSSVECPPWVYPWMITVSFGFCIVSRIRTRVTELFGTTEGQMSPIRCQTKVLNCRCFELLTMVSESSSQLQMMPVTNETQFLTSL